MKQIAFSRIVCVLAMITFVAADCNQSAVMQSKTSANDKNAASNVIVAITSVTSPSPTSLQKSSPSNNSNPVGQTDDYGKRQRIEFESGKTSAVIRGVTPPASFDHYTVRARAGQQMTVQLISKDETALFDIYAPGFNDTDSSSENMKKVLTGNRESKRLWTGKLPFDGDYEIELSSRYGGSKYSLKVTVQ